MKEKNKSSVNLDWAFTGYKTGHILQLFSCFYENM